MAAIFRRIGKRLISGSVFSESRRRIGDYGEVREYWSGRGLGKSPNIASELEEEQSGFWAALARTRGSHQQFKHPTKSGLVTVAGKPSDHLAPGTLNSILKQAGLR